MKRVALLFAVSQEAAPLLRRIASRPGPPVRVPGCPCSHGTLGDVEVLVAVGGMGARRAERAARALLDSWSPDLLVMTGVAGALSPTLSVADVLAGSHVFVDGSVLAPPWVPAAPAAHGLLLAVERVLVTAAEKASALALLPRGLPAAVEMETRGLARAAAERGVAWGAVRAVSDTADADLPLDFNRLLRPDGSLPLSRVAAAALARPTAIPGLLRLGRGTAAAAAALAEFWQRWAEREPS